MRLSMPPMMPESPRTVFIEFMLSAIKASLMDAISASDEMSDGKIDKATLRWNKIQEYLKTHDYPERRCARTVWCIGGNS